VNLYDRARKDTARILGREAGFTVPAVFTSPAGVEYSVRGFFIDVNFDIDPTTGLPIVAHRVAFSVSRYDADGVDQFPGANPADTAGIWRCRFTNSVGESSTWIVENPAHDRTLGHITMQLKKLTARSV
jgi:hypothetical protein